MPPLLSSEGEDHCQVTTSDAAQDSNVTVEDTISRQGSGEQKRIEPQGSEELRILESVVGDEACTDRSSTSEDLTLGGLNFVESEQESSTHTQS